MSVSLLTLFQFLETLAAYLFVTLALPCAFLSKRLSHYRFMERILFYFISGNFYATNLVFLLELLHISNFFTLWAGLLLVPAIVWVRLNQYPLLDKLRSLGHSVRKLLTGTLGIRSVADAVWRKVWRCCFALLKTAWKIFYKNLFDWLLIIALTLMVMWVYGINLLQEFGYKASDIPVHMYWVNGLSENQIFVGGIYPLGMHAVIYLINECFGIDTYVLFRVFALVQCLAIHMMALLFLKLCCKSRYAAYPGVFLYTIANYFAPNTILRYLATLPQETSMIYILPTAYYAFYFFREKRREIKEFKEAEEVKEFEELERLEYSEEAARLEELEELKKLEGSEGLEEPEEPEELKKPGRAKRRKRMIPEKSSRLALAGLIMSFSLCVTAHFYGAIVAAIFCVGIAVGYAGWLIRPSYFKKIITAALISVAIAVLPMGIAFVMGTPLQGSLGWATNVIKSSTQQREEELTVEPSAQPENTQGTEAEDTASSSGIPDDLPAVKTESSLLSAFQEKLSSFLEKIIHFFMNLWEASGKRIESYILRDPVWWYSLAIRSAIVFLIVTGVVLLLLPSRARMYGAALLSTGIFMLLMSMMFSATLLEIPALMDGSRTSMFFSYMLIVVAGFTVDVCVCAVTVIFKSRWPRDILSFAVVVAFGWYIWQQDMIRPPLGAGGLEYNEAITCLTNIIATEPDNTWTIFSANDETRMVFGHGYHYELITFLQEIETLDKDTVITVPTETVYFFIEKNPLEYWSAGFSQPVSREGAEAAVPRLKGLDVYKWGYRWIVMSHMYYWAQEFQRLYPNEMKVYMETDDFICYCLKQNTYRLYNLAIDYGYNYTSVEEQ